MSWFCPRPLPSVSTQQLGAGRGGVGEWGGAGGGGWGVGVVLPEKLSRPLFPLLLSGEGSGTVPGCHTRKVVWLLAALGLRVGALWSPVASVQPAR